MGEEGRAYGVEGDVDAAVFGEGEYDFGEVEFAGGYDVGGAEGLKGRGLGFVGSDGEYACAFQLGQLDRCAPNPPLAPVTRTVSPS